MEQKRSTLVKSAVTVGVFTLFSRVVGFVRDMVIATTLGTGPIADAFFVAFRLPNLFRSLFAEGAFNAAFVPLFAGKLSAEGIDSAKRFAEQVLIVMLLVLVTFTVFMQIAMPWAMYLIAPGFTDNPEQFNMAVELSRITFPYLLFITLVSLLSGVLNSIERFSAAAMAPIFLNLSMICTAFWLNAYTETPAEALAWGVAVGGVTQLIWMVIACIRADVFLYFRKPALTPDVKKLLKRMIPGIMGAGVTQINLLIGTLVATLIPSAVSLLYYADRITQFPLAIIGTAMGTAMLPSLSKAFREDRIHDAIHTQNRAMEFSLFFTLPAAVALMVSGLPIVTVLFNHGAFTTADAYGAYQALFAYTLGLPAFVLAKVLLPGFFAHGNTKTPVKIAVSCLVINTVLNIALVYPFHHTGIAIGTSIAAWVNALLLWRGLRQRSYFASDAELRFRTVRIIISSILMGCILYACQTVLNPYFGGESRTERVGALLILVSAGFGTYIVSIFGLKVYHLSELKSMLTRRAKKA
ncbi:MAG: Virulence factor MVIN-like [Rickettsiales bacterium]|jgi:putative peptidoglycan lipid II flippase|nr:Virulence factor MVIN-like [Rickettsiales bacterium]